MGGKRLRAEALLAAAASPPASPPLPVTELVSQSALWLPDPLLVEWVPQDLPRLLALLADADLCLQDEVEGALHPTLTRVWCPRGRRGQRLVEAPGTNVKRYGFGLVDWREGWCDWALEAGRCAAPFCAQLRCAVARSTARGRRALVLLDNLSIHTPRGARLLRALLQETNAGEERLVLVSTPAYDPEANRIEWRWRALRHAVTHYHTRETLDPLLADADAWATALTPANVLAHLGSPCLPPARTASAPQPLALTPAA